jgi:hypothetical protein
MLYRALLLKSKMQNHFKQGIVLHRIPVAVCCKSMRGRMRLQPRFRSCIPGHRDQRAGLADLEGCNIVGKNAAG